MNSPVSPVSTPLQAPLESPPIDEVRWNAWAERGRLRHAAGARHAKIAGGVLLVIAATAFGAFTLLSR